MGKVTVVKTDSELFLEGITRIQKAHGSRKKRLVTCFLEENKGLSDEQAIRFCTVWRLSHLEEDMKQASALAMIKAIDSFKPHKKGKKGKLLPQSTWNARAYFANWFWLICREELQRAARTSGDDVHPQTKSARKGPRVKYVGIADAYSSSATQAGHGFSAPDGFAAVLGSGGAQELHCAINELPGDELLIVRALANGSTPKQIAKSCGVPLDEITDLIAAIREKLT